ncbi:MAG: CAP domain-containing protein [Planctomycetaceae bacterium]|nr:CAP domain-containing protein [Planctomycetaceae bacterium]
MVERELILATNSYRQRNGLGPLAWSNRLNTACESLLRVILSTDNMGHQADGRTPADRVSATGYSWTLVAENLAMRTGREFMSNTDFAHAILQQWIDSPGHNQNLLVPSATECGVAVGTNQANGKTFAVMIYTATSEAR